MASVLLTVDIGATDTAAGARDLINFVVRLYEEFNKNGCRVVLATSGGGGLDMDVDTENPLVGALQFPVDVDEMEEKHFAHYQLLCIVSGQAPRVGVVHSGQWDSLSQRFAAGGGAVSFVHPHGAAFIPPCASICGRQLTQKNLGTDMDGPHLKKLIEEVKQCLTCVNN